MSHLLIDAKNNLYRAVYATKVDNRYGTKYHSIIILLKQMVEWINEFRPTSIHVFWDAPRNSVWRKKIFENYKNRDDNQYVVNLAEDLSKAIDIAKEIFQYLNIHQYDRDHMEADDLIYAASILLHPNRSIIISTDSDMLQIPFAISSSIQYNPKSREIVTLPDTNPAMLKSLVGDKSDCIDGYHGIGPKKGRDLLQNISDLYEFLAIKGPDIYYRNQLLIDLSICPKLLPNKMYVQRKMSEKVNMSEINIKQIATKYKLLGLETEYHNIIPFFKNLQ